MLSGTLGTPAVYSYNNTTCMQSCIHNLLPYPFSSDISLPKYLSSSSLFVSLSYRVQLQSSSNAEPVFDQMKSPREPGDKPKDPPLDKASALGQEGGGGGDEGAAAAPGSAQGPPGSAGKPGSPAVSAAASSPSGPDQKRLGPDVTSQGVQTTSPSTFTKSEDREEKKEAVQE